MEELGEIISDGSEALLDSGMIEQIKAVTGGVDSNPRGAIRGGRASSRAVNGVSQLQD